MKAVTLALSATAMLLSAGCGEPAPGPEITRHPRPANTPPAADAGDKQILFGDLHVHTTYSMDAYEKSLSFLGGEGAHPPADACDFARYCSQLDFWSINDHAEFLTPERWDNTKDSIRQCNAVSPDQQNPDMVSFLGWEWTQIGATPEKHYGHKNVILAAEDEASIPARPVHSARELQEFQVEMDTVGVAGERLKRLFYDNSNFSEHWNYLRFAMDTFSTKACDPEVNTLDLPTHCSESAPTPDELFSRLDQWRSDYVVIPHGNSWGLYTPPGSNWRKQLQGAMHNPARQTLIEVYSGHGNSEEFRAWRATDYGADGGSYCPPPGDGYLPCCWRAAQLVHERCADPDSTQCREQMERAKSNYLAAGSSGHLTLTGVTNNDWLNCGQCEDCFLPAFSFRPRTSAQAALATSNIDARGSRNFRFGFIASSDNHSARPGTGYKEYARGQMTDVTGATERWAKLQKPEPQAFGTRAPDAIKANTDNVFNTTRRDSFLYTGGLVAVHSEGRNRGAIWDAIKRREVYGTSGPRLLLWFDLLKGDGQIPMGGETAQNHSPTFRVRALGSTVQHPGCPEFVSSALPQQRLQRLCHNECFNPGDERYGIERLEIVRILPQQSAVEPLAALIQDPWRSFDCGGEETGCEVLFEDPEFTTLGRNAVYYVRAVQQATPTINAANLRCEYDAQGRCVVVRPCRGDYRTPAEDNCLAEIEHRAWSSPIFVDYKRPD